MQAFVMLGGTHYGSHGEVVRHDMPDGVSSDGLCLRNFLEVTPFLSPPPLAAGEEPGHVQAHP